MATYPLQNKQPSAQGNYSKNNSFVSIFNGANTSKAAGTITIDDIVSACENPPVIANKLSNRAFICCESPTGGRKTTDLEDAQYSLLVADVDRGNRQAKDILVELGCPSLIYSTYSAAENDKRWRVVIPLAELVGGEEHEEAAIGLRLLLGGDAAMDRGTQLSFMPAISKPGAFFEYHSTLDDNLPDAFTNRFKAFNEQAMQEAAAPVKPKNAIVGAGNCSVVEKINDAYDIRMILEQHGYKLKRNGRYLAPNSQSRIAGLSVFDGCRVYSHHGTSDKLSALNHGGHALDATDVLCALQYSGDLKRMVAEKAQELDPEGQQQRRREYMAAQEDSRLDSSAFEEEQETPFASEFDLSDKFVEESGDVFRWTPGLDWMVNKGSHWGRDEALERYTVAKRICRGAASSIKETNARYRTVTAKMVSAVLTLSRSEQGIVTPIDEWDKEPMLLNTRGGVYDLTAGKQISRGKHLFTQVTSVAPDASMKTPNWDRFLSQVFSEDLEVIEFIQRMAGYCMTGDTREQQLFFLHGTGSNGKNVFIDALHEVMGSYSHNLPSEALMRQRNEGHPTIYASLFGKRLAVSSEIEDNAYWAESKIKELTGNDTLSARHMRQDFFTFKITHKHLLAGNYKPRLKGDDYAMVRRMVLVPFEQTFTGSRKDPSLPRKLKAEYPGILAWFIEGARKWSQTGLQTPQKIVDASKAYMADNDDLALWIDECCDVGGAFEGKSSDLYQSFRLWKETSGEKAPSNKAFSQRLEVKFRRAKTRGYNVFQGVDLRKDTSRHYGAKDTSFW